MKLRLRELSSLSSDPTPNPHPRFQPPTTGSEWYISHVKDVGVVLFVTRHTTLIYYFTTSTRDCNTSYLKSFYATVRLTVNHITSSTMSPWGTPPQGLVKTPLRRTSFTSELPTNFNWSSSPSWSQKVHLLLRVHCHDHEVSMTHFFHSHSLPRYSLLDEDIRPWSGVLLRNIL